MKQVPSKRPRSFHPWLISGLTLAADQFTKSLIAASFYPGKSIPSISHILHLTYVQNTGAAFGIFKGQQFVFIVVSIGVIAWVIWEILRNPIIPAATMWACGLILGGALGNLIDRVRVGYVIDFIDLRLWPVFNIGDSAITIGVSLLISHSLAASRGRGARGEGQGT